MQLQQSGFSSFGYSPSASTAASGSHSGGTSQATARKLLLGSVWSALGLSGPTGGVQDIASALSSALSAGLASGQDLAPQLTQTVDNALDQVSQQLEAQGVSPDHVAKLVARFRQDLANAVNSAAAAAANGGAATSVNTAATNGSASGATTGTSTATSATPTAGVSASSSSANSVATSLSELATVRESETLTIQTTDGAQVTLRFRARGAELGTSQTQPDGSTSTAGALFASSKFQVEVSGNLSSADLTAINNIVSQVDSLATQFFSGDVQDAFAAAANIGADPSEIAGFSLQMSYSATSYQQSSTATAPSTTNTAAPVVTNPTTTGQAGTASAAAANTNGTSTSAVTTPTPASTTPATAAPAATATPQQVIANFLQNALAKLGGSANGSGTTLSARWGFQLLAVALPAYAQAQTAPGSPAVSNPISASPPAAAGNSSPAVTQVAVTAPTQAAHLAAATLIQLIN